MGVDFIRNTADRHTKAWDAAFENAANDLFADDHGAIGRSYFAVPVDSCLVAEGDAVLIRLIDKRVLVLCGLTPIAEIAKPSVELLDSLDTNCNILDAHIDEVNNLAKLLSVRIGMKEHHDP